MSFLNNYPQLKIIQEIARKRKTAVYLIGGFLRDLVLGRTNSDFDFAVEKDALKIARLYADKIKGAYILLDEERGCARVAKKNKGQLFTYDFADFRAKTFEEDLAHRDFTINTLAVDVNALDDASVFPDVLIDNKKGLRDLKAKRIKRVSVKAFKEDPLRMLRAFSLRASLGFRIDLSTLNQIRKETDLLSSVSYERIREELFKVLESPRAGAVLHQMDKSGILVKIIPQIRVMYECTQGGYHHLDVWPHSLETVKQVEQILHKGKYNLFAGTMTVDEELRQDLDAYLNETVGGIHTRRALIKLGALLHDIGKPDVKRKEAERTIFHGHECKGRAIVKHVANMLKLSTRERHAIEDMTLWHLRPGYLSNFKKPSDKAVYRFLRDGKDEAVSIVLLSLADQRSTRGPMSGEADEKHHEDICLRLVKTYFDKKKEKPFVRLINGDDLIKKLKIKPSPLFAKILDKVEEEQVLGKIKTKKQALEAALKMVDKGKGPL